MDQTLTKQKIKDLRALVGDTDRVAILLQDDPDPDAMSSAMALRTLLRRNKLTTPIFCFSPVTRPENRNMMRLLEIEIEHADAETLGGFEKVAMVDVQPGYFAGRFERADIVIDHHPGYPTGVAGFEDVRTKYGATATLMTEYLVTADERISERLATALLYGIKSDTLMLSRRVTDDDLQAFTYLYPLANYGMLKQIERPELPVGFAQILSKAMKRFDVRDGLAVLHLGRVERDDLVVQMADFCLDFEGVEWVAVSGKLDSNLVIAVRNPGTVQGSAGELVKRLFGEIGSAGGHRNMAKAVIPIRVWRRKVGSTRDREIESRLLTLFAAATAGADEAIEATPANGRNGS